MSRDTGGHPVLERMLAAVLRYGTWLASGVMAAGLALAVFHGTAGPVYPAALSGTNIITAGIALLILLPVLRVALMLAVFLLERDYRFATIATVVLAIIFLAFLLGLRTAAA